MEKYINVIAASKLFDGKSKTETEEMLPKLRYKVSEYGKNQVIFSADDTCSGIYLLLEGEIEIQKTLESGRLYNILYKKPGDTLGGAVLFSDEKCFQMDLVAKSDCKLLQIPEESVREVLCADSRINLNIMNLMANSVMNLNKRVELFSVTSIRRKIAFSLLNALENSGSSRIAFPITKKQWSEHLNVSRPSLSRELKKLQDEGVIEIEKSCITVINEEYLKEIVQKF